MKRRICILLSVLLMAPALFSALPVWAEGTEDAYQIKGLTTYLYSADSKTVTDALFTPQLPTIPYLEAADFLDHIFTVDFSTSKNADGTYSVTSENGTMVVDPVKDTLYFDAFEDFIISNVDLEGSTLTNSYAVTAAPAVEGEARSLTLDPGAYGIDLIEYRDSVYIPLPTLADLAAITYNTAAYVNETIYFVHTMDDNEWIDRSPLHLNLERDPAASDFTYRELCFFMDHFYGAPEQSRIAKTLREKGFDIALDEYSDGTRTAKALLQSNDRLDFMNGMLYLDEVFFDGGHTSMTVAFFTFLADKTTPFYAEYEKRGKEQPEHVWEMVVTMKNMQARSELEKLICPLREPAYAKYETVKAWGEDARFIRSGDTGVFVFDQFTDEVVEPFRWSLNYAAENGIRNFVLDLTCNEGGSSDVVSYMFTVMTNAKAHTNVADRRVLFTTTGNTINEKVTLDLNLDGVFDERDCEVEYDLNFAVLSTPLAFSCGNLLPCMARDNGIAVLGDTSGGGSCGLFRCFTEGGYDYMLSSPRKFLRADGTDADLGSGADYYLVQQDAEGNKDYSGLYDLEEIGKKIHEYYGN